MTSNTLRTYVERGEEEVTYEAMECSRSLHYALVLTLSSPHSTLFVSSRSFFLAAATLCTRSGGEANTSCLCVFYYEPGRRKKAAAERSDKTKCTVKIFQ